MKILRCKQHGADGLPTATWLRARRGRPTASRFADIITPLGKTRTGQTPIAYMHELAAERITGQSGGHYVTAAMERGTALEPQARAWYELSRGVDVREVGMVMPDHARWGCSPDGLVGDDGGLEIKCPLPKAHVSALLDGGAAYSVQVQASLWITGRAWWDVMIYTDVPRLPNAVFRVDPDPAMHAALDAALPDFCGRLDEIEARLIAMGAGEQAAREHEQAEDDRIEQWFRDFEAGPSGEYDAETREGGET